MPHAEKSSKNNKMAPQVNGDPAPSSQQSAFLAVSQTRSSVHKINHWQLYQHLVSYPVINDSITSFKSHPYGAKSLSLTSQGYEKLGAPLLPYLSKPYEYVSPYVKKADSLGDSTLSSLDTRFPAVKKPTSELYQDAQYVVFFPLIKGTEGKEYVLSTYKGEVKKVGGEGVVTYGKAAVGTGFKVAGDSWAWLNSFVAPAKEQAKEAVAEKNWSSFASIFLPVEIRSFALSLLFFLEL